MGYKYQKEAEKLGAMGRNGDSILMHINPLEVQAIEKMHPGSISINPDTGQPEAFFFLLPALLAGLTGTVGTAVGGIGGALAGGVAGVTGSTALGALAASPLTAVAGGLGTLGGTSGIAGSMGGLAGALGAPAGAVVAGPSFAVPAGATAGGTAGATGGTAGATAGGTAGGTAGATGIDAGLASAIETGAGKLGSALTGQITGPTDLLTTGIDKVASGIAKLGSVGTEGGIEGAAIAPGATTPVPVGGPVGTPVGTPIGTPAPSPVTVSQEAVKAAIDPQLSQGIQAGIEAAKSPLDISTSSIKEGLAAAKGQVNIPKVANVPDLGPVATGQGGLPTGVPGSGLQISPIPDGARVGVSNLGHTPGLNVPGGTNLYNPPGVDASTMLPVRGTNLSGVTNQSSSLLPPGVRGEGMLSPDFTKLNLEYPSSESIISNAPQASKIGQGLGKLGKMGERAAKWGAGKVGEGIKAAPGFAAENPMLVLGGGYMLDKAMQDPREVPDWAKDMKSKGTGPGEIWSDDYQMQVIPTFQGMESPEDWEDQWYVDQFNPYAHDRYTQAANGGYINPFRYAGGGYVNPFGYVGGGYMHPRMRRR